MKNILVAAFAISLIGSDLSAQDSTLRKISNSAFTTNEVLEYRVHYGFIDAGEARLEIGPDIKTFANRSIYHVVGTGKTKGAFDWFFKVRDRYESYIDSAAIVPWYFVRRVDEGGYHINQNVTFNHHKNIAISEKKTIHIPHATQDIISAYYYSRTLNFDTAKVNDIYSFNAYLDDEVIPMNIKFLGREKVKTGLGTFNCIKFRPVLLVGRVFKEEEDMTIWVTDDKNKIVVRAQAEILVGSVKMDLKDYSGLANPLLSKIK
ncbi:MAG: DUF3108 domain-containing protein [Bacteroidia bacterium]